MKKLTPKIAKACALKFVEERYKPVVSNGFFNHYYIVVGIGLLNGSNSVYVEPLSNDEIILSSVTEAKKYFYSIRNDYSTFLIKVNNLLEAEFIYKP